MSLGGRARRHQTRMSRQASLAPSFASLQLTPSLNRSDGDEDRGNGEDAGGGGGGGSSPSEDNKGGGSMVEKARHLRMAHLSRPKEAEFRFSCWGALLQAQPLTLVVSPCPLTTHSSRSELALRGALNHPRSASQRFTASKMMKTAAQ